MKRIEMTVLKSDMNAVIEYLGRHELIHFPESQGGEGKDSARIRDILDKLRAAAEFLALELPAEPEADSVMPGETEEARSEKICAAVEALKNREIEAVRQRQRISETFSEARAFSNLNAPFADLDQLSYLTLRVGRLDPKSQPELRQTLSDRAVIIPLGGDRILAAGSRKGRFALDSELKKYSFEPIAIPEGYQGIPAEMLYGLEGQLKAAEKEIAEITLEKGRMKSGLGPDMRRLAASWLMALAAEQLKAQFTATESIYLLSGWTPEDTVPLIAADLSKISAGRVAIRTYKPDDIPEVRDGTEKVPVALKHGAFVKGFEGVVFSYGAPLYGTIDPTPLVAIFFTILFGIMFGDVGQGFVLFLAGLLAGRRGLKSFARFGKYSSPLIAVGIASMIMGILNGEVFTIEELLVAPTRMITGALTGHPMDRILNIMPLAEKGGSVKKLFYFFGFTIGIGVILNSLGLLINIVNRCIMKKYESAFFSKTGLAGLLLFWYAIFIAIRCVSGGRFEYADFVGLLFPVLCIFFGPAIWRCIAREKPVLEHGIMTFIMEGFVEILETASTYISNTVSFLRVGAFALSHAVLSYIVFRFSEELASGAGPAGSLSALLIMIFGNALIIVLEGMIVAIQVVRLQYYEFFSKFFTETGVEFSPFRFRKKAEQ
ncbi:MAG: V-type ATP synthase subunit I [Treponema sp.]|jgi:V/A-type H+-transporting ATPase subunit I|nr:V-type ATP synthase subunit I [Treponema sp.]